ncbi:hypothetical protein GH714_038580 [Hevea brasiliensis]|uniref:Uncharacterized protein n=1 Tax=Hevea brasiliensis TaxID=3981 RepID=A0A6A6KGY7_HEVBR|nr:hypothetical protein GH714_038580 [Hevea brasiliensis]
MADFSIPTSEEELEESETRRGSVQNPTSNMPPKARQVDHQEIKKGVKGKVVFFFLDLIAFLFIMGLLIACLTVDRLHRFVILGSGLWKWCLLMLAILCGILIAYLLVEALDSLVWKLGFDEKWANQSRATKILKDGLLGCLIGTAIWLLKTFLVYVVGSSHAHTLFGRIKKAICNRKVLISLSKKEEVTMEADGLSSDSRKQFLNLFGGCLNSSRPAILMLMEMR